MDIVSIIRELGFPIFVAGYLLIWELPKSRKASEKLQKTMHELLVFLKAKNGG